jgi:hypothetical protein
VASTAWLFSGILTGVRFVGAFAHAAHPPGQRQQPTVNSRKTKFGIPGTRPKTQYRRTEHHYAWVSKQLANHLLADVLIVGATRVTITPAAVEITSAGICATRPSPMVNRV